MLQSMTGFGKGSAELDNFTYEIEIKSLNSRFLDISLRVPKSLQNREFEIRELVKKRIKRGKVTLSAFFKKDGSEVKGVELSESSLNDAVLFLKQLKSVSESKEDITLDHLISVQHLFLGEGKVDDEKEFKKISNAVSEALDNLVSMRLAEGKELEVDLLNRIEAIEVAISKIEETKDQTIIEYFEKIKERAKDLVENISQYDDRLQMELALLSEKYDVSEECVRMRSHIKMFKTTVNKNAEAGKKLNFILQEMNREANTINSKTVSSDIAYLGITIKDELEKIREQIQNIE